MDLSHPVHADNCILDPDSGECWREPPAYTYRDYRWVQVEGHAKVTTPQLPSPGWAPLPPVLFPPQWTPLPQ